MNVRLVAYRKATSSATSDNTYQLDLQEAPNISLNFQFADIKEPETRKGSYSQTFKLPFTQKNNEFFQTWFNVNLSTLVFNTRTKFNATLFYGTIPQFEGFIQLKAVYLNAQLYEITLMSNSADLFNNIGNKKLRDIFTNDDGTYSGELNHLYNVDNIKKSWDGSAVDFLNVDGVSLRDGVSGVQKVLYPLSVTRPNFYYNLNSGEYLAANQTNINAMVSDVGTGAAMEKAVHVTQFRPSLQIKTILKILIARAGFSFTSDFIDGAYFGKLFMTTCGQIVLPTAPNIGSGGEIDGTMSVGNSTSFYTRTIYPATDWDECEYYPWALFPANTTEVQTDQTIPSDPLDLWNTTYNYFTKIDTNQTNIKVKFRIDGTGLRQCGYVLNSFAGNDMWVDVQLIRFDVDGSITGTPNTADWDTVFTLQDVTTAITNAGVIDSPILEFSLNLNNMNIGESAQIMIRCKNYERYVIGGVSPTLTFTLGQDAEAEFGGLNSLASMTWIGYGTNIIGKEISIRQCIDAKITQKAFLKDLIERFNLVVIADPRDQGNIIIEPYNEYLGNSEIKHWTDKLDSSKEIIIKDTTSLQKKTILLTDLEDVDLMNKSVKEEEPNYNVYGKIDIQENNNDWASGEMKNSPIFSPYLNQKVFRNNDADLATFLRNVAIQYEYTYKKVDSGYENSLEATQPKLFYYSGSATTVSHSADPDGSTSNYYMHSQNITTSAITAHTFTEYPLCSPFQLSTSGTPEESTITTSTLSLFWNQNPPPCPQLNVFNYNQLSLISINSLYFQYWAQYFNTIYHPDSRIMECYLNLTEVDIATFRFNDEIFIKDTYWRILNISNYQVGGNVSTKVTLIKQGDIYAEECPDANYLVGDIDGSNTFNGVYWIWCPVDNPTCTPDLSPTDYFPGLLTDLASCDCANGKPGGFMELADDWPSSAMFDGAGVCFAMQQSLPINLKNIIGIRSIFTDNRNKSIISGKIEGLNMPLIVGNFNDRYSTPIMSYFGNDVVIKYNSNIKSQPQLDGESHRMVLSGFTEGDTRGYAYPQGDKNNLKITIPIDTNMIIRLKGIATVVGGKSTTYTLGTTEGFAYYTAFKNVAGTITQLSTAGGQQEFSIREGANPTTCTLNIVNNLEELQFGLDDSQTDTKRIWSLTVDLDVNRVYNLGMAYNENWALYQNSRNIQYENEKYLIWN